MQPIPLQDRDFPRLLAAKARANGDRTFLLFEDRRWSYAELDRLTDRMANGFRALGVKKGERVATLMANCPELLFAYFALTKLGAVVVPVNTAAKGELLVYYLVQSGSRMLVAERDLLDRFLEIEARGTPVERLVVFDEKGTGTPVGSGLPVDDFAVLAQGADEPPNAGVRFTDLSHLSYTSGTTGPSKGNMATHAHTITQGIPLVATYGYDRDDILYTALPLLHGNALLACVIPALLCDGAVALSRRFSASAFWSEVKRYGATQFNLLGAMANILWSQPPGPQDRDHKVRQAMVVPTPTEFYGEFEARYGVTVTSLYALSDYGMITTKGPDAPRDKMASAGQANADMEIAVVDDDDVPLPAGEVGEIVCRSREPWFAPLGYYDMPAATLSTWRNLWFHTGDRGRIDADGWLYFVDRKKDAIRRRGQNISSYEVEQIIMTHAAVADVAVFPVRSEMSEDEVMACLVLKPGAALDEPTLTAFCAANMAYFMVPRYIEFRPDLPRTASEKVQKYRLKEEAEARLDRLWDREKAGIKVSR